MIGSPATDLTNETSRLSRASGCVLLLAVTCTLGCSVAQNEARSTRDQAGPAVPVDSEPLTADSRSSIRPMELRSPESGSATEASRLASVQSPMASEAPAPIRVLLPTPSPGVESFEAEVSESEELKLGPREEAISILLAAGRSEWPQFRANALEALTSDVQLLRGEVVTGLLDENRGVRFVALMALYKARMWELAPLVEPLLEDPSDSVRAAALLVLDSSGEKVDPTPLAAMAMSGDPEIRANAYVILGLLGNQSAVGLIRESLKDSPGLISQERIRLVDLQAAAALVRLGDAQEIQPLRAASSPRGTVRADGTRHSAGRT